MAEYIEKKQALDLLHSIGGCDAEPDTWADGWDKAINEAFSQVDKMPSADVVEVVKCKDCVKLHTYLCPMNEPDMPFYNGEDYCSYGRRETGEN